MRMGEVIGNVTLSRAHPELQGVQWKVVLPMSLEDLSDRRGGSGESLVVYDALSAGEGEWIAISEGREAAMPFHPDRKPVDAYNAAILDTVEIDHQAVGQWLKTE
jgi:ethanolamine utilization protein EutN